jgi:HAD superfamily hydrolase (TIGR01450 family)
MRSVRPTPSLSTAAESEFARGVELDAYAGFLVDLDGTLLVSGNLTRGAAEFWRRFGDRSVIVSNNSSGSSGEVSRYLLNLGLPVPAERIVLAGSLTIEAVALRHPSSSVLLLGSGELARQAVSAGLRLSLSPEAVIVGRSPDVTFAQVERAANAVRQGAKFYVTNPDLTHPAGEGAVAFETGAVAAAVAAVAGREPDEVFGKPDPRLFEEGLRRLALMPQDVLMIGDNPQTDAEGAARIGLSFHLVGS